MFDRYYIKQALLLGLLSFVFTSSAFAEINNLPPPATDSGHQYVIAPQNIACVNSYTVFMSMSIADINKVKTRSTGAFNFNNSPPGSLGAPNLCPGNYYVTVTIPAMGREGGYCGGNNCCMSLSSIAATSRNGFIRSVVPGANPNSPINCTTNSEQKDLKFYGNWNPDWGPINTFSISGDGHDGVTLNGEPSITFTRVDD